ncbi:MAG: hybrid sensor histidine kinase/response regulator transcription factor, partial [Bacteroidota bacterium]
KDPIFSGKGLSACQDGFIYIGQKNGYYRFSPDSLSKNQEPPALAFTYFNIFEKPTKFEQNLNFLSTIELDYQQNFFTIGFAALNFTQAEKNSYAYKLEGYDADWIYPMDNRNFATYTKVPPGDYTFKVKAANNEYIWTEEDIQLNLHISSPPWQSWWAYLLYALTIGSSLYFFYRFNLNRKLEQQEAKRVKELNQLKTKLYNNITHEFRTPITLILGFIDRAMQSRRPLQEEELEMMKSNSHQLLQLINQMLDLGKVDAGRMEIKRVQANITEFLQYLTNSFKSLALQKEIVLSFQSPQEPIAGAIDKEKLLIILSNLLSNALKFTARQGHISLNLQATGGPNPFYCIQIKDTGSGIAPEELPNIFDRFYQSKDEAPRPAGTGIGLSLVKELVDLLDGRIKVESEVGKGTQFTIELPLLQQAEPAEQPAQKSAISVPVLSSTENSIQQSAAPGLEAVHEQKPLLLLVEDHPDLIQYIAAGLEASYRLAFAQDGLTGLQKTFELMPDLIVSDVMMPELDGLSMCQQLKQDARSSHIPIVLLTARSGQASKLEGLKEGADVYLTKPFHDEELRLHIRNLLEQQKRSHNYFRQQAGLPSSDVANKQSDFPSKESVFLQELKQMVHDKLDDPNMNVATLSKLMGLSHTQLHRKLVALTGLPPVKYIRSLRLEQAKLLLKDPSKNISDVAYATGFSDPAYFSRIFKKETGQAPSAYRGFGDR